MFYSIGYVEPHTSLMLAAGLEIAKAISSKRVDKRFVGEVMDGDTVGSTQDENTYHNSNQLAASGTPYSPSISQAAPALHR